MRLRHLDVTALWYQAMNRGMIGVATTGPVTTIHLPARMTDVVMLWMSTSRPRSTDEKCLAVKLHLLVFAQEIGPA